tara:strand:+ start:1218 stop:1490 length:273 start_codon:yes stop_codon:yes gene_type:complete
LQSKPLSLYLGYINSWREKMIDEKTLSYIDDTRDYLHQAVCQMIKIYLQSAGSLLRRPEAVKQQIENDKDRLIVLVENIAELEKKKLELH